MPNAAFPHRMSRRFAAALAVLCLSCSASLAQGWPGAQSPFSFGAPQPAPQAVQRPHWPKPRLHRPAQQAAVPKTDSSKTEAAPASGADEPPPPYEPELLRLSEILGALTYLRDICGHADAESWRSRMQALLDSEAKTATRKEHLAGAYNRGFHGYEISYRACTPNAQVIIKRFLAEGEKIAHDVANRYGAS
jgi:uncharacterized protein (TIGR02301 family)